MNEIETVLGLDIEDEPLRRTAYQLLAEQIEELQCPEYEDPPPDVSGIKGLRADSFTTVDRKSVAALKRSLDRHWEERPLPALLQQISYASDSFGNGHADIVAKTVHLSLSLAAMGVEYKPYVLEACRRVWLLIKADKSLLEHLPSFRQSFAGIAHDLDALSANLPDEIIGYRGRIKDWKLAFTTFLDQRTRHSRIAFGSDVTAPAQFVEYSSADDNYSRIDILNEAVDVPYPDAPEEAQDDQPKGGKTTWVRTRSTPADRSNGQAHYESQEILNRQLMENSASACWYPRLTPHQIRRSFCLCFNRAPASAPHLVLSLALITGRRPERLMRLELHCRAPEPGPGEYWLTDGNRVWLCFEPKLPAHRAVTKLKGVPFQKDNGIQTALPPRLASALLGLYGGGDSLKEYVDIRPAVKDLTQKIDKKITAVRVSNALAQSLRDDGLDEVTIAWLTGASPKHHAAMYYTLVSRQSATDAYCAVVNRWLRSAGSKDKLRAADDPTHVGTRVRIPPKVIARSFHLLAESIGASRNAADATCIYTFHNCYAYYVCRLVSMAVAIRAVTEPVGKRSDINVAAETLRIADKANRVGGDGRVIALGRTATDQLSAYHEHLIALHREFRHHDPQVAAEVGKALDGSLAYLFFFDKKRRVRPLRPKQIVSDYQGMWPFPTNWARHSLSAWLLAKPLTTGAVRAFYGHSDFGLVPFARFDATSMSEIIEIAKNIDKWFENHNVRSIGGWNTRT